MSALRGQVALVTGGAGGLGTAICRMLSAEGATAVVADVRGEQAEQVGRGAPGRAVRRSHSADRPSRWRST